MIKLPDSHGNFIIVTKDDVLKLALVGETAPRTVGTLDRKKRTLYIKRKRERHLLKKADSYGFCHQIINEGKQFDHVILQDEQGLYKIPREVILEKGSFLWFKNEGFERQLFLSLKEIRKYKFESNKHLF